MKDSRLVVNRTDRGPYDVGWQVLRHDGAWYRLKGLGSQQEVVVHYTNVKDGFEATDDEDKHPAPAFQIRVHDLQKKGQAGGLKFDAGKDQWSLLLSAKGMLAAVQGVVRVLMFGAKKYAAHSWREVEDNERRYLDGLMRHYAAIMKDGITARDEESGLLHIDHLNCNGLFLGEIARQPKD